MEKKQGTFNHSREQKNSPVGNGHRRISDFTFKIDRDRVLHMVECDPESPAYQEMAMEFQKFETEVESCLKPSAILHFGKLHPDIETNEYKAGTPVCYIILTVGDGICEFSRACFEKGDYLAGLLADAIGDDCLFQLDGQVQGIIREECLLRHSGVLKRLEAPKDIPMGAQQIILEETGAGIELGMGITDGYMLTTMKSIGYILILTEDEKILRLEQDCRNCVAENCNRRKNFHEIEVIRGNNTCLIKCGEKESILEAMIRREVYVRTDCGGRGTCGKCKIQVIKGKLDIHREDRKFFSKNELEEGHRLACIAYPEEDCTIRLSSMDEEFAVITENAMEISGRNGRRENYTNKNSRIEDSRIEDSRIEDSRIEDNRIENNRIDNNRIENNRIENKSISSKANTDKEKKYGIAIDIGTTTIVISLVGLSNRKVLETYSGVNRQRVYGADVVARIQAANSGKRNLLQKSIREGLLEGIRAVITRTDIDKNTIKQIAIAGNTVMGHLLMGYSCRTLGIYPFAPVNIKAVTMGFAKMFASDALDAEVTLLPGISTYVGADITAGLTLCNFDREERPSILIDLGTNGEMAIGMKDRILVSSTAAGPAFEGGNISCGVGSISGSICSATIRDGKITYQTIGGKPPVGICGTGVVEITAELVKAKLVDQSGLLAQKYLEEGVVIADGVPPIVFTQKDIREIQLAKAAIRAGLETLIMRYDTDYDAIGTVYLAGGFGYRMNLEKALSIGLLPAELSHKVKAIGNSALAGAMLYLTEPDVAERMEYIRAVSMEIHLGNDGDFQELYMKNINL